MIKLDDPIEEVKPAAKDAAPAEPTHELTSDQKAALAIAVAWDPEKRQFLQINGLAGTGKTSLVPHIIKARGLGYSDVVFAALTGKACQVLNKKGMPAQTIHSLIYRLVDLGKNGVMRWEVNKASVINDCKLVALDEVSMIREDVAADLLSFGKPVLVLGDHGQLPPIDGPSFFAQHPADAVLETVHRQAAGNPIIQLAHRVRTGLKFRDVKPGEYDDRIRVIRQSHVTDEDLLGVDQVICGFHKTRFELIRRMRKALGFEGRLPVGPQEKLICIRNERDLGLFNGMPITFENVGRLYDGWDSFKAVVLDENGRSVGGFEEPKPIWCTARPFLDHVCGKVSKADWENERGEVTADFAYALTCHKAQGSEWGSVLIWDDGFGQTREEADRWRYTAVTRASRRVVLAV
jgi:exodeoxyribonuclease V